MANVGNVRIWVEMPFYPVLAYTLVYFSVFLFGILSPCKRFSVWNSFITY